jgi:hypothetical protein
MFITNQLGEEAKTEASVLDIQNLRIVTIKSF